MVAVDLLNTVALRLLEGGCLSDGNRPPPAEEIEAQQSTATDLPSQISPERRGRPHSCGRERQPVLEGIVAADERLQEARDGLGRGLKEATVSAALQNVLAELWCAGAGATEIQPYPGASVTRQPRNERGVWKRALCSVCRQSFAARCCSAWGKPPPPFVWFTVTCVRRYRDLDLHNSGPRCLLYCCHKTETAVTDATRRLLADRSKLAQQLFQWVEEEVPDTTMWAKKCAAVLLNGGGEEALYLRRL